MSKIAAGTILVIETGEYSDKSWHGPFRVLKDFSQEIISEAFRNEWTPDDDSWRDQEDGPEAEAFIPWLTRKGYIEDVDGAVGWHVGSYGFDPQIHADGGTA